MPANTTRKSIRILKSITEALKHFCSDEYTNPDLNTLKDSLLAQDESVRRQALDALSNLADLSRPAPVDFEDFVDVLLNNLSVEYDLIQYKGDHRNFIDSLAVLSDILMIAKLKNEHDFERVLPYFDEPVKNGELEYLLVILSYAHNTEHLPVFKKYLEHPSPFVRAEAQMAMDDINYHVYGIKPENQIVVSPEDVAKYENYQQKKKMF